MTLDVAPVCLFDEWPVSCRRVAPAMISWTMLPSSLPAPSKWDDHGVVLIGALCSRHCPASLVSGAVNEFMSALIN